MSRLLALFCLICLPFVGCGRGNHVPPSPPAVSEARESLIRVLDSWKQGETAASLTKQTPPVYVADHDWSAGRKLKDYQIKGEGTVFGNAATFNVDLSLDSSSSSTRVSTTYAVTLKPVVNVSRSDPSS